MFVCLVTMQGNQPCMAGGGTSLTSLSGLTSLTGLTSTTSFLLNLYALGVEGLAVALDEELTVAEEFIGHL